MAINNNYTAKVSVVVSDAKLISQINQISAKIKPINLKVQADTTSLKDGVKTINTSSKELNNVNSNIKNVSASTKTLGQDFASTFGKVAKFGAVTALIGLFTAGVAKAGQAVKEFDSALIEFNKVSDMGGESLSNYTKQLASMGEDVARTGTEMLQASTEFVKAGYSEEQSAQLAKTASLFQNIADSEMTAGDSASFIISQMKAFNITADDSIKIIDSVNEVSNRYAVSSTDLTSAMTKTSSAMGVLGNSFDETLGLVTAGTEIMTGQASKVSRGLRTIGNNIADLANKEGKLTVSQGNVISLFDENTGAMKSTMEVMTEVNKSWGTMTNAQKQALAIQLAGKNQFEVFTSIQNNFKSALDATETSVNSAGSAMKENEAFMKSLTAGVSALKSQFEQLVLSGGLGGFAKGLLNGATAILKLINAMGGLPTLLVTVTGLLLIFKGASIGVAISTWIMSIGGLSGAFETLVMMLSTAKTGVLLFGGSVATTNLAIQATIPVIGLVLVALSALVGGILAVNKAEDAKSKKIQESIDKTNEEIKTLDEVKTKLEEESLTREELNTIVDSNLSKYSDEIGSIEDLNKARQASIDKINDEIKAKSQKIVDTGLSNYESALGSQKKTYSFGSTNVSTANMARGYFGDDLKTKGIDDYVKALEQYQRALAGTANKTSSQKKELQNVENELSDAKSKQSSYTKVVDKYNKALEETGQIYDKSMGFVRPMKDSEKELAEAKEKSAKASNKLTGSLEDNTIGYADMETIIQDLDAQFATLSGMTLGGLEEAFGAVREAQDSFNNGGNMSVSAYEQLMSLSPEYIAMLFDETGALDSTTGAEQALYGAKIDQMAITSAYAQIDLASKLNSEGKSYAYLRNETVNATSAEWGHIEALAISAGLQGKDESALLKRISSIQSWANSAKKSISTAGGYTNATKNNTSATKGNTSAQNANTDALKEKQKALQAVEDSLSDEVDDYERAINYIKKLLNQEKDAVEKEKDAKLDAIDEQIDALDKLQDAEDARLESQIDILNTKRDAEEAYWDAQIDAIEKTNDALDEQIKLQQLQSALASAKTQKVRVLKGGQFVYTQDESAVSKAEQELADYEQELAVNNQIKKLEQLKEDALKSLDNQIQQLEKYRDEVKANYEKQVADLEEHRVALEKHYNEIIQYYETYIKNFENMVDAYQDQQDRLLAEQLLGTSLEKGNWDTRLGNLQTFVNGYHSKVAELSNIKSQIESITAQINGQQASAQNMANNIAGIANGINATMNSINQTNSDLLRKKYYGQIISPTGNVMWSTEGQTSQSIANTLLKRKVDLDFRGGSGFLPGMSTDVKYYATGVNSVPDDQIAIVADPLNKGNSEMVVGAGLNRGGGVPLSMKRGTGVINSPHTKTLTEQLINMANGKGYDNQTISNKTSTSSQTIIVENITLPSVTKPNEFVRELNSTFFSKAVQSGNTR